ncbi:outer membrane protein [Sphingomonas psychrolutea]|uniref:Outer membrane protein beta-barrel domain-containing protein n=1 Tax=Sphingomonas psychrolutea TaxID=1259676 RepID=A0ABQ1GCA4_9SPHN|nr:outer membrane beta-barrel protein [Sphingomonas psychrolutea]GGA40948.1 hypothetical protein GCM10011395_08980 [Sphingomonas psychrolutea]
MGIQSVLMTSAALAAAMFMTPALAQSTDDDRPFQGLYVGASGGYDFQGNDPGESVSFDRNLDGTFGDTVLTTANANAFSPGFCDGRAQGTAPSASCENDRSRLSYNARVGYDLQLNHVVIGAVIEGGRSNISDFVSAFSTTPASYTFTTKMDFNASARGRLGYAFDKTLFYGTGGLAYAKLDQRFETSNTANSFAGRGKRDAWGYTAGGGVEQKIAKNISFTAEYIYNDVKADRYIVRAGPGTAPATNPFLLGNASGTDLTRGDRRFRWHSIRAGLNFRF